MAATVTGTLRTNRWYRGVRGTGKNDLRHQRSRFLRGRLSAPPAPAQEAEQAEAQDEDPQAGGSAATNAAAAPRATVRDLDQRPWAGVARAIDGGDLQEEVE